MKSSRLWEILQSYVIRDGSLRTELVRGTVGSFGLKVINALLNLALSIVLARILAPEGYGIYAFAFSVMTLLAVPVQLGLPALLVREVACYQYAAQWGLLRGILERANQAVLLLSLVIGLAAAWAVWWLMEGMDAVQRATLGWALLLLPLGAFNRLREAALQGLRQVVMGQLPEKVLLPVVLLVLLGIVHLIAGLTPSLAMALYCAAAASAFLAGAIMLLRALPAEVRTVQPQYDSRTWARSVLPLSLLVGLHIINGQTGIFMLGLLATKEDVGLYRVAFSGAALVIFALSAVNAVLAPHIARLHRAGDMVKLQRMVTQSARLTFISALPVAGIFIIFGTPILGFVFGEAYYGAYIPLIVLCIGQLVNASFNSVSLLLIMTRHEQESLKCLAISVIANVALNAMLIPFLAAGGAAFATSASLIIWRLTLAIVVRKKLRI